MKAIKTTIGILASVLALNAIAQSDDSVSATMGAGTSLSTTGVWTNPMDTYSSTMDSKILSNNSLINAELAKRDATITDLQNQLNKLKTASSNSTNLINNCSSSLYYSPTNGSILYVKGIPTVSNYCTNGSHSYCSTNISCSPAPAPPGYVESIDTN